MYDRFDIFRDEMGAEIVDNFLAKFGLGPDYKPAPITTQVCLSCLEDGAYLREFGTECDGGQNIMALYCPNCKFTEER